MEYVRTNEELVANIARAVEGKRFALEEAFRDWYAENANVIEGDGGTGDVVQLFACLTAAIAKS